MSKTRRETFAHTRIAALRGDWQGQDPRGVTDDGGDGTTFNNGSIEANTDADDGADAGGWVPDSGEKDLRSSVTSTRTWGRLAEQWIPQSMKDSRVDPGKRGALLLSSVAAIAAVVAAAGVWWNRPEPVPVTAASTTVSSDFAAAGIDSADTDIDQTASKPSETVPGVDGSHRNAAPASEADTGPIVVSVTGRVAHAGLVTLASDARVADAIAAAGGADDEADLTGINLAAHLHDGDSIVVANDAGSSVRSDVSDESSDGRTDDEAAKVSLNDADMTTLQQLSGIGPVTAQSIVTWRDDHGPFTSIDQLQAISGIGPATYALIAPHVTL